MKLNKKANRTANPPSVPDFERFIPKLLVGGGIIGLIAAFIISYDKLQLLKNPAFQPGCDLNPVISCGTIMGSAQGEAFGFPNPWIGLVSFAVLITIGMGLLAGARFKRWFWIGLQAGTILGLAFVHWLFFQSAYRINALCPYCMVVWVTVITTFWYVTLYNIQAGHIKLPARLRSSGDFVRRHHLDILLFWLLVLFVLIMARFWYYFGRSFGA